MDNTSSDNVSKTKQGTAQPSAHLTEYTPHNMDRSLYVMRQLHSIFFSNALIWAVSKYDN